MKNNCLLPIMMAIIFIILCITIVTSRFSKSNALSDKVDISYLLKCNECDNSMNINYLKLEDNIYLAISNNYNNILKLQLLFKNMGYETIINKVVNNNVYEELEQYDLLIGTTSNSDELLAITKVMLATYDEIINAF